MDSDKWGFCRKTGRAAFALAILALGVFTCAQAQTLPPNVQQGVDWLSAQVRSDGSLTTEAASIATPFQARQESQITLTLLASAPGALSTNVAADADTNVEYTARRIIAAGNAARDADVAALLAAQNTDGGWGADADFQSDPLDTAFALQALAAADASAAAATASGLGYLTQAQSSDGGWGVNDQSSVSLIPAFQPHGVNHA